jgi:hypothetical protein
MGGTDGEVVMEFLDLFCLRDHEDPNSRFPAQHRAGKLTRR